MTMIAIVTQVNPSNLLVRDASNDEEVLVHFRNSRQFTVGNVVRIFYNGQMTLSIPPQITAISIQRISGSVPPEPEPAQIRAIVLQVGRGFLTVWNLDENMLVRVEFANANRFSVGQQIVVRYDTIIFDDPPRVTATNIILA